MLTRWWIIHLLETSNNSDVFWACLTGSKSTFQTIVLLLNHLHGFCEKNANFQWSTEQGQAFLKLKNVLQNSEVLAFPRFDLPFYLAVDSSAQGIGYVLYQKHLENSDEKVRFIRFGSKTLISWQKSYGPTKLELLVTSIVENSRYLRGNKFILECDHQALFALYFKINSKAQFTIDG